MHVSGHTGTIRGSVTANMNLICEQFFWYCYRVQCDRGLRRSNGLPVKPFRLGGVRTIC